MNPTSNTPNTFDTSFLPQQPMVRGDVVSHRKEPIAIGMIVALVVFFITLSAAGGVLLFKKNIERRILSEKAELASKEAGIDMKTIADLERVSDHLSMATTLLSKHSAFPLVLDIVAQGTAVNVGYTSLSFGNSDGAPSIALSGVAPSYEAVYFQGQAIRTRPYIMNATIGGVSLDARTGTVGFSMDLKLKPDALLYGRYFETKKVAPPTPANQ